MSEESPRILYAAIVDRAGIVVEAGRIASSMSSVITLLINSMNFSENTRKLLKANDSTKNLSIQYIIEDGVGYISATNPTFQSRLSYPFLEKIRDEHKSNNSKKYLRSKLLELMDTYSFDPKVDSIRSLESTIDSTKNHLIENIHRALERKERLEDLNERTNVLVNVSSNYTSTAKDVKLNQLKQNYMFYTFIVVAIVLVLAIGAGIVATFLP
eukprot:TRINITY_DN1914_c0_g1_i1.p1 TRINITY_DN1914_c0_g1~~TRINITY_DN1914_c0_g1_i1.p1  ORF type:complete len:213 (+),score=37.64 TRINITY_DN1914_c0_g1_i1:21-659(+)